jgi:hypothetical protein
LAAAHDLGGLGSGVAVMTADESAQDLAGLVGKHVSTVIIAMLVAMFAYGYLSRLIFG